MKRALFAIVAVAVLVLALAACGGPAAEEKTEIGTVAKWDYGEAEILDAEFLTAEDGTDIIRVNFTFTNPTSEPIYFVSAFSIKAFQNGVELDSRIDKDVNSEEGHDLIREIMDGASLDVFRTFTLRDDSPVEVRVCTATAAEDLLAMQTFTP